MSESCLSLADFFDSSGISIAITISDLSTLIISPLDSGMAYAQTVIIVWSSCSSFVKIFYGSLMGYASKMGYASSKMG